MNKKRTLVILILIVILPLSFLAWQSIKIFENEKQVAAAQFDQSLDRQLTQLDDQIHRYFQEQANHWIRTLPRWKIEPDYLRQTIKTSPHIRQIFVLSKDKKRIFPADNIQQTAGEKQLVERLDTLWNDPERLFSNGKKSAESEELNNSSSPRNVSKVIIQSSNDNSADYHGWYRWHWGAGANIIFWWTSPAGKTIGLELESSRIMADIIGLLPTTPQHKQTEKKNDFFRIRLQDEKGHIVYQWGKYDAEKTQPLKSRMLSYPLSSWMFEYHGITEKHHTLGLMNLIMILAAFALTLGGLVYYVYREQSREMRLASQRVHFVSQVSHELKTPLTNIRMYAEMLENSLDDDPQPQKYSRIIVDESQRLTRLISNVLSFSRTPRSHKQWIDPNTLIHKIIESFTPSFDNKNISINITLNTHETLFTDPDLFEQIINNLLSNVEKYASEGKRVEIHSEISQNDYIVSVRDYGAGIPNREKHNVFKAFYRLDNRLSEGVSGTGIGLTISRQQAESLGGSLELISVGLGACFELRLPISGEQQ